MIKSSTAPAPQAFVASLAAKARAIGEARARERVLEARRDPWRWRNARLLWPLFGDR